MLMSFDQETAHLFVEYNNKFRDKPLNLSMIGVPLGVAVPRLDYYLSWKSIVTQENYESLIDTHFKDGLKALLIDCHLKKRLNKKGRTTNPLSYLCKFKRSQIRLLWIPKNACTHIKRFLGRIENPDLIDSFDKNRFHESIQESFGYRLEDYLKEEKLSLSGQVHQYKTIAIVRDPIERIVSCYLDKFVKPIKQQKNFEPYIRRIIEQFYQKQKIEMKPEERSISFSEFVLLVTQTPAFMLNEHWRPQYDFLEGISVDTWICMDKLSDWMLEFNAPSAHDNHKSNVSIARKYTPNKYEGGLQDQLPSEINLQSVDDYSQFVNRSMEKVLRNYYRQDYDLVSKIENK